MSEQLDLISLADLIEQIKIDLLTKGAGNTPAFHAGQPIDTDG